MGRWFDLTDNVIDGVEDTDENEDGTTTMFYSFYTEKSTHIIYEVQFFDTFVMYRPASPAFRDVIRKLDLTTFLCNFDEYQGDSEEIENILTGNIPWDEQPLTVLH